MDITFLITVLLMFLVLKANRTIAVCAGPKRKEFALEFPSKTLVARLLGSRVAMDEMNCQFSCHANDFCDAYNFNTLKTNHQCELLDGRNDSVELEAKQDWKFRAQKCEVDPCKNSATCIQFNDRPNCLCPCGWKGKLCDVPITNSYEVMSFPRESVEDFVAIENPFSSALSQLSISMWAQLDPAKSDQHTLMSYGSVSQDFNDINLMIGPTATWLCINRGWSLFDDSSQLIKDNDWHHFLLTWENVVGKMALYIDGVKRGEKVSIAIGQTIDKTGALVIGHEQDSYKGGFEQHQALKGNITSGNMWDRVLTAAEISSLASKCPTQEGNLVKWSDLKSQPLQGDVKMLCSFTCAP